MRLLIVGSSHTAAVYAGWKAVAAEYPQIEADFLAAPVTVFARFSRGQGAIYGLHDTSDLPERRLAVMRAVNGELVRDLAQFTHVTVIGQHYNAAAMLEMLLSCGVAGLRSVPPQAGTLLSLPAFRAFCRDIARKRVPGGLRSTFAGLNIAVSALPMRSETVIRQDSDPHSRIVRALEQNPEGVVDAHRIFAQVTVDAYAEAGMTFIPQPAETLAASGYTLAIFNRGSLRLDADKTEEEYTHMNADYGALVARAIGNWVSRSSAAGPSQG